MRCIMILSLGGIDDFFEAGTIISVRKEGAYIGPGGKMEFLPVTAELANYDFEMIRMLTMALKYTKVLDFTKTSISETTLVKRRLQKARADICKAEGSLPTENDVTIQPKLSAIVQADFALKEAVNVKQRAVEIVIPEEDSISDLELGRG